MGSLKYEITQIPISLVKIKNKKSTIMTQTVKEYRNDAIHFGEWCKKHRGIRHLDELCALSPEELLEQRYRRYRRIGVYEENGSIVRFTEH